MYEHSKVDNLVIEIPMRADFAVPLAFITSHLYSGMGEYIRRELEGKEEADDIVYLAMTNFDWQCLSQLSLLVIHLIKIDPEAVSEIIIPDIPMKALPMLRLALGEVNLEIASYCQEAEKAFNEFS